MSQRDVERANKEVERNHLVDISILMEEQCSYVMQMTSVHGSQALFILTEAYKEIEDEILSHRLAIRNLYK